MNCSRMLDLGIGRCDVHKMPVTSEHGDCPVVNIDEVRRCFCKSNSLMI